MPKKQDRIGNSLVANALAARQGNGGALAVTNEWCFRIPIQASEVRPLTDTGRGILGLLVWEALARFVSPSAVRFRTASQTELPGISVGQRVWSVRRGGSNERVDRCTVNAISSARAQVQRGVGCPNRLVPGCQVVPLLPAETSVLPSAGHADPSASSVWYRAHRSEPAGTASPGRQVR